MIGKVSKSGFSKPALRPGSVALGQPALIHPESSNQIITPTITTIKRLVWVYLFLLILEGALRKWVVPQYSTHLLLIRDPIVLWIYFLAYQGNLFPEHKLFKFLVSLCASGLILLAFQLIIIKVPLGVLIYGYRTAFLHFPLIFLLPAILTYKDLLLIGRVILLISIPMALLMGYQFRSSPDAWINRTVGVGGGYQIASAMGKIRPPGTFSFISGPVSFYSLVTAFIAYGLISSSKPYSKILLISSAIALGLAVAVSGSRATMLSGMIVIVAWLLGVAAARKTTSAFSNAFLVIVVATFVLGRIELFTEGTEVLGERFEMGQEAEAAQGGMTGRFFGDLTAPFRWLFDLPIAGLGLGVGTNVGAALIQGKLGFLLAEGEWGRNLLEMGPIFGLLYIYFRVKTSFILGQLSLDLAKQGHLLPLVLFSACVVNLICGQIAQPTILGFVVFTAALCVTAINIHDSTKLA